MRGVSFIRMAQRDMDNTAAHDDVRPQCPHEISAVQHLRIIAITPGKP
jgi:hypothetical protein